MLYGVALIISLLVLPVGVVFESALGMEVVERFRYGGTWGMLLDVALLVWGLFMIVVLSWRKLAGQKGRSSVPVAALKWNALAVLIATGGVCLTPLVGSPLVAYLHAALLFAVFVYFFHHKI